LKKVLLRKEGFKKDLKCLYKGERGGFKKCGKGNSN
jgi:hypothetical protein